MKKLKELNPVWFARESLNFMQGYSKFYIWSNMPIAYAKFCYYTLGGK